MESAAAAGAAAAAAGAAAWAAPCVGRVRPGRWRRSKSWLHVSSSSNGRTRSELKSESLLRQNATAAEHPWAVGCSAHPTSTATAEGSCRKAAVTNNTHSSRSALHGCSTWRGPGTRRCPLCQTRRSRWPTLSLRARRGVGGGCRMHRYSDSLQQKRKGHRSDYTCM